VPTRRSSQTPPSIKNKNLGKEEIMGAKPSKGTPKDKRLKANKKRIKK